VSEAGLPLRAARWAKRKLRKPPVVERVPTGTPTVAAITMAANEGPMLQRWVDHYAKHVGRQHLIVLDDNSTDGSTEGLDVTVHHLPKMPGGDDFVPARMDLMSGLAQGLLAVYDYVIFTDVDEFLIPDPAKYETLPQLIAAKGYPPILAALALNVVHVPALEPEPLDLSRPILEQRSYAKFTKLMCKPSTKRVPARWALDTHGITTETPFAVDPELFMVHLKFADRGRLAEVVAHRKAVNEADGRAQLSSWSKSAAEILAVFDKAVADVDPATVPEFDPSSIDLASLVVPLNDLYRTVDQGQIPALRNEPFVRIPERLKGSL